MRTHSRTHTHTQRRPACKPSRLMHSFHPPVAVWSREGDEWLAVIWIFKLFITREHWDPSWREPGWGPIQPASVWIWGCSVSASGGLGKLGGKMWTPLLISLDMLLTPFHLWIISGGDVTFLRPVRTLETFIQFARAVKLSVLIMITFQYRFIALPASPPSAVLWSIYK